jgi:hypothetical protein
MDYGGFMGLPSSRVVIRRVLLITIEDSWVLSAARVTGIAWRRGRYFDNSQRGLYTGGVANRDRPQQIPRFRQTSTLSLAQ